MRQFIPTNEWKRVHDDEVIPPGCEIRMSVGGGLPEARLRAVQPWPKLARRRTFWQRLFALFQAVP